MKYGLKVERLCAAGNNNDFKTGGKYIETVTVGSSTYYYIKPQEYGMQDYMRRNFLNQNSGYRGFFTIFSFALETRPNFLTGQTLGNVQHVGIPNVNLFDGRNNFTLCHETLHGLGLYHTHRDAGNTINEPAREFIFVNGNDLLPNQLYATDNFMSYSGPIRKVIWEWQKKVITKKIKK